MARTAAWPPQWCSLRPTKRTRSRGPRAVEFIESYCRITKDSVAGHAGELMVMRPWQRQLLTALLAEGPDGMLRHRAALIGMSRKNGKALSLDSALPTPAGWTTMGEVAVGDQLLDETGRPCRVVAATKVMRDRPCYRVTFSDGASIVADAGHEWLVVDRGRRSRQLVLTTEEMSGSVTCGNRPTHNERRYSIPVAGPLDLPHADLPVDPYVLGVWLGDGTTVAGQITTPDVGIWDRVVAAGYELSAPRGITRTLYGLQVQLRALGVLGTKHIPAAYLRASTEQRTALLHGLMDTDGHCTPKGQAEFTTTTEALATGFTELAVSLGHKPTVKPGRATLYGKDCGPKWRIQFWPDATRPAFHLQRKAALQRTAVDGRSRTRQIVAIDKVDSVPVRCVEVDSPSHLYLVGPTMIPTHNSALGAALALEGLFLGPDGGEVYSCAATRDQARIVFGAARRMVELDPEMNASTRRYRDAIEIPSTGSIYRVLSREAGASEGLSPTRVIFDEVHVQPDDEMWNVMALAGGARVETQLIGITTAGARTDTRGQDSHCYRLYQYGRKVATRELADPSFFFAWWEPAAGAEADHTDPKVWAEANPGLGDLCTLADFEATLPRTPEAEFRTKRTNVWVTSAQGALPHGVWNRLAEPARQVAPDVPVVYMADGSWSGDSTGIVGISVEERPHVWVVDLWEKPADDRTWRVPVADVEDALRTAARSRPTLEVGMDPYRWQRSMQILDNEGLPMLEYPMGSTERMCKAWKTFYDLVLDGGFTHSGDPRLARHIDAMVLKYDAKGARPVKDAKLSTRHIDLGVCVVAGIERAVWHAEHRPETTESIYESRDLVTL